MNDNDSRSFHTPDEFRQWLRTGDANEMRALGVGVDAEGGFLVPEGFRRRVAEALKSFGGVRQVAEIITTNNGQDLPFPTSDDTGNVGAILAENTQVPEQDVVLGQVRLFAHMYTSKLVRASIQVIEDSGIDIESLLARRLAERIGRAQNTHFTTGTGTGQPAGVQTNATVGKTGGGGQTTSVTYDDLVDLLHSVDPAYREGDDARWMVKDTTFASIRKLRDADGRPLLEPDVKAGAPNMLLGYRIQVNNDMPAMAASAKSILFGNFRRGYVIRDVRGLRVLQLRERYADFLQVGFLGFVRADGRVQDAAAVKAYANAAV